MADLKYPLIPYHLVSLLGSPEMVGGGSIPSLAPFRINSLVNNTEVAQESEYLYLQPSGCGLQGF
jgi:hypothetical protein